MMGRADPNAGLAIDQRSTLPGIFRRGRNHEMDFS
jgi:hypothetical protein